MILATANVVILTDSKKIGSGGKFAKCYAVSKKYSNGEDKETFVNLLFLGEKMADVAVKHFKKGKHLFISGSLQENVFNNKKEIEIHVDNFSFLPDFNNSKKTEKKENLPEFKDTIGDEDIPF